MVLLLVDQLMQVYLVQYQQHGGVGDGSSTFNLPDLRGQFVRGWDNSAGVDSGRSFASSQTDQNKEHTHSVTDPGHNHTTTFDNKKYFGGGSSINS